MGDVQDPKPTDVELGEISERPVDVEDADEAPALEEKKQFLPNGDDPVVVTGREVSSQKSFAGMDKEALMYYADDPYWVRTRIVLFILFWVTWLGILVAAIVIIVLAPKCAPIKTLAWFESGPVYQIYTRSFADSDGDGNGDINGIKSKLKYLQSINTKAIWLSSIYSSVPGTRDIGYDIVDQKKVDAIYGTLDDVKGLVSSLNEHEMKLVIDFVPKYTSREHQWFVESSKGGQGNKYADYYIWLPGTTTNTSRTAPNDWLAKDGKPAWNEDTARGEFYFSMTGADRPELNLRNKDVLKDLEEILKFWMGLGVSGFYVAESENLVHPKSLQTITVPGNEVAYTFLNDTYQSDVNESLSLVSSWKKIVNSYGAGRVILAGSLEGVKNNLIYYPRDKAAVADLSINSNLFDLRKGCDGKCVLESVNGWMESMPAYGRPTWMTGSSVVSRIASAADATYVDVANMLMMLMPGTPLVYYGEELGMTDTTPTFGPRTAYRGPMQWDHNNNIGFGSNGSWVSPNEANLDKVNVKTQLSLGAGYTCLNVYQALANLRLSPSFLWGDIVYSITNDNVFSFVRQAEGFHGFLVVMNFGKTTSTNRFSGTAKGMVPMKAKVIGHTQYVEHFANNSVEYPLDNLSLNPGGGIVFTWENNMK